MQTSRSKVLTKFNAVERYAKNPIIQAEDIPFSVRGVFNSSAIKFKDRYIMVLRCEGYNFHNFFVLAESPNGIDNWTVKDPLPLPETEEYLQFARVQYDPRITEVEGTYYITFCCHSVEARMGLISTTDFESFEWRGFITGPGFRNTVLFPEKIDGKFMALERPNSIGEIWTTCSPDLRYWGDHQLMMKQSECTFGWGKIGPCGTPIRTDKGWLIIFHGVSVVCDYEYLYHAGVCITELENPSKLIRVGQEAILTPELPYENYGHTPNCIFASSQIVEDDGSVKIYYGASDRYQCVAFSTVDKLLEVALNR